MLIGIGFFGIESFPLILFSCPYFSNPFIPLLPKNNQTLISNLGVMWNEMKLVNTEHQMSLMLVWINLMLVWINIQRKRKQRAVMNYDHQTE